jgi:hypothetical protein
MAENQTTWHPGYLRIFVSHRDSHKVAVKRLADALFEFGISCFVAHEAITPPLTCQREIENALKTMDLMLAFVTDNFGQSPWTNQEVGFAFGQGKRVIALKMQRHNPRGFLSSEQALRGGLAEPEKSAEAIYRLLVDTLDHRDRLQGMHITAFLESSNFNATIERFDRMTSLVTQLDKAELARIQEGFRKNDQIYGCAYLRYRDRLQRFLERGTGKSVTIDGKQILTA